MYKVRAHLESLREYMRLQVCEQWNCEITAGPVASNGNEMLRVSPHFAVCVMDGCAKCFSVLLENADETLFCAPREHLSAQKK